MTTHHHLLEALNPPQRQAVDHDTGPLLVLSGAGTGKTKVLVHRIAYLIARNKAQPHRILSVTFTNKAAKEMKERITSLIGAEKTRALWAGTFHALSLRILQRHKDVLDMKGDFAIIDKQESKKIMQDILKSHPTEGQQLTAKTILAHIDMWKNQGLRPQDVDVPSQTATYTKRLCRFYHRYQDALRTYHAMDFGDLILQTLQLWKHHGEILDHWQSRFSHILVDEYQDTNTAQYLWLRLLAQKHHNICCVGDDDQSIYGWRGADINNILRFEQDFPQAKTIRLEQNYRSTPHILSAASCIIKSNTRRLGKTLWTNMARGEKIHLCHCHTHEEEAMMVSQRMNALRQEGVPLKTMAVLVRVTAQISAFEDAFSQEHIDYRIIGGTRFFDRKEIRGAIAYWRLAHHSHDDRAFLHVINMPKRGVGDKTQHIIQSYAIDHGLSCMQATQALLTQNEIKGKTGHALSLFLQSHKNWRQWLASMPHQEAGRQILEDAGYLALWHNEGDITAQSRGDNIEALINTLKNYANIAQFIDHVSLLTESEEEDHADKVSLMTLHASKGLEFDVVFLPGWEDGIMPHKNALEEDSVKGIEEERRLAHVGITRAKKRLYISHCTHRQIYQQWVTSRPSPFLSLIPSDAITCHNETERRRHHPHTQNTRRYHQKDAAMKRGDYVRHPSYGYGVVQDIDGDILDIIFDSGQKKILSSYVKKDILAKG
ncbi:MAG: UvrD-helicase domain-containing protein [Alphaproteobacteria bacterium GM7ARS4]|nr:UvrD-helicase domain-containing protein [Alphaproteobacteria bacterium GM7ARS4]